MPNDRKKPLNVYGGSTVVRGKSRRVIVSASSRAEAVRLLIASGLKVSAHYFANFFCKTSNEIEVRLCSEREKTVFVQNNDGGVRDGAHVGVREGAYVPLRQSP